MKKETRDRLLFGLPLGKDLPQSGFGAYFLATTRFRYWVGWVFFLGVVVELCNLCNRDMEGFDWKFKTSKEYIEYSK